MSQARLFLNPNFRIDEIDPRIFGSFIESGSYVRGLIYNPSHPEADERGMRKDTMALLKELGSPVLRVGGCYSGNYDWKEGIGPQEDRIPRFDPSWEEIDDNKIGLDEYDRFAKAIGAEVMPTVNLGTVPLEDVRSQIEYTNNIGGSKYSDLRIRSGHPEPYGYKVWYLGNELDGRWQVGGQMSPDIHAWKSGQAAIMMNRIDPTIKIAAVGSSHSGMPHFCEWEYKVLMQNPRLFDYISIHTYYGNHDDSIEDFLSQSLDMEAFIRGTAGVLEAVEAKKRIDKKYAISMDEWNVSFHQTAGFPRHTYNEKRLPMYPPYSAQDVPLFSQMIMTLINHADRVKIACVSLITSLIWDRTEKHEILKTPVYHVFKTMNDRSRGYALQQSLETEYYSSKYYHSVPFLETASVLHEDGSLTVFAASKEQKETIDLELCLSGFGESAEVTEHVVIRNADPHAINTVEHPDRVAPVVLKTHEDVAKISIPPLSFNAITVSFDKNTKPMVDFGKIGKAGRPANYIYGETTNY